jgi:hypothetical protein
MHKKLEMRHHKPMLLSFTVQGITELHRSIKRRLNFIIHSPQTEETKERRWLSGTVTGAELELGKVVNEPLGGMELLPRKASQ